VRVNQGVGDEIQFREKKDGGEKIENPSTVKRIKKNSCIVYDFGELKSRAGDLTGLGYRQAGGVAFREGVWEGEKNGLGARDDTKG